MTGGVGLRVRAAQRKTRKDCGEGSCSWAGRVAPEQQVLRPALPPVGGAGVQAEGHHALRNRKVKPLRRLATDRCAWVPGSEGRGGAEKQQQCQNKTRFERDVAPPKCSFFLKNNVVALPAFTGSGMPSAKSGNDSAPTFGFARRRAPGGEMGAREVSGTHALAQARVDVCIDRGTALRVVEARRGPLPA